MMICRYFYQVVEVVVVIYWLGKVGVVNFVDRSVGFWEDFLSFVVVLMELILDLDLLFGGDFLRMVLSVGEDVFCRKDKGKCDKQLACDGSTRLRKSEGNYEDTLAKT